jgi:hypothetical protein
LIESGTAGELLFAESGEWFCRPLAAAPLRRVRAALCASAARVEFDALSGGFR